MGWVSFNVLACLYLALTHGRTRKLVSRRYTPFRSLIVRSWNHFGCNINEDTILSAANALVSTGLRDLGYECTWS